MEVQSRKGFAVAKRGLLIWGRQKIKLIKLFNNDDRPIIPRAADGTPIKNFGKNGIIKTGSSPMTPVIIDDQIIIEHLDHQ